MSILLTDKEIGVALDAEVEENFFKERPLGYGAERFVAKAQLKKVIDFLCDYGEDATLEAYYKQVKKDD